MNRIGRILSFLIVISLIVSNGFMLFNLCQINVNAENTYWEEDNASAASMPFRPIDKSVVSQNPPDFSWVYVDGAVSYTVEIASDKEMSNILHTYTVYKNLFNPKDLFDAGTYYWRVKYQLSDGAVSSYSKVRRFRILEDYTEFLVDDIDTVLSKIPTAHPRVFINENTISQIRDNRVYIRYLERLCSEISGKMTSNTFPMTEEELDKLVSKGSELGEVYKKSLEALYYFSAHYAITGSELYIENLKTVIDNICEWNFDKDKTYSTSYKTNDTIFKIAMFYSSVAYDWAYDKLEDERKEKLFDMITKRSEIMYDYISLNDELYKDPYHSHDATAYKYLILTAIALKGEGEYPSEKYLNYFLPLAINLFGSYHGEDGGAVTGTGYWQYVIVYDLKLADGLKSLNLIDLYKKPVVKNNFDYLLYMYPKGSVGAFGDESYNPPSAYTTTMISKLYETYKDSVMAWAYNEIDEGLMSTKANGMLMDIPDICGVKAPFDYPNGKLFKDTGVSAMHSDLTDGDRISLFFRSSKLGAFNHAHPDQNSFVIQAYGENLAIDSGYYDYYYSEFDKNYTRRTYAHNAITYNNGTGQEFNRDNNGEENLKLKGNIEGFITTDIFDSVTGNAKESYGGELDKIKRSIVYLRPDVFIVIDDLKYKNDEKATFEFFLNGYEDVDLVDNNTATIKKGKAELTADVLYPLVTGHYSDKFAGPDGIEYTPSGTFASKQVHQRAWFKTSSVNQTKMVTTLTVNKENVEKTTCNVQNYKNYILITVGNTKVYVNLTDELVETNDGVSFSGASVAINGENILLTDGNYLSIDGKEIINSDKNVSVYLSEESLKASLDDDGIITISNRDIFNVTGKEGKDLIPGTKAEGVMLTYNNNEYKFDLDKGEYEFSLNLKDEETNIGDILIENKNFSLIDGTLVFNADIIPTKKINEKKNYSLYIGEFVGEDLAKYNKLDFSVLPNQYKTGISTSIDKVDTINRVYKAFLWENTLNPQMNIAEYNKSDADIDAIYIDGTKIDCSDDVSEYDISYNYLKTKVPDIKVIPKNSASKVVIKNISKYPETAIIKVTSQDGTSEKVIKLNFSIGLSETIYNLRPSYYALSQGNAFKYSCAPTKWSQIPTTTAGAQYIWRRLSGSRIPYSKFDFSEGIDLNRIKSITVSATLKETEAIYEGEPYTEKRDNVQKTADDSFEKVVISPKLVFDPDWYSNYSSTSFTTDIYGNYIYPEFSKYKVGTSVTIEIKNQDVSSNMEIDMNEVKDYLLANKSLSLAFTVDSMPKGIDIHSEDNGNVILANNTKISDLKMKVVCYENDMGDGFLVTQITDANKEGE